MIFDYLKDMGDGLLASRGTYSVEAFIATGNRLRWSLNDFEFDESLVI